MLKVFSLTQDLSLLGDYEFHAELVSFEGSDLLSARFVSTNDFDHPDPILLQGDLKRMAAIDYPYTNLGDTVMSRNMYDVLAGLELPKHEVTALTILDDTHMAPFDKTGKIKEDVETNQDFAIIQLLEHTDALNLERSDFKRSRAIPGKISVMRKLVLKKPENGFPALFRIPEYKRLLFVSEEAKEALEKTAVRGCQFEEVEVSE